MRKTTTLQISTGDITREDSKLLETGKLPCIMQNEYGFLVAVLDEATEDIANFSIKFQSIYKRAKIEGVSHIHVDMDEEPEGEIDPSWK
jgi:hypothetical protein